MCNCCCMRTFNCNDTALVFNDEMCAIVCVTQPEGRKLWVKKFTEPVAIQNVLFDDAFYYVACRTGEAEGMFLSLVKSNGFTRWFIPGRTFLEVLYDGFLYLIFVDEQDRFFLIKVNCEDGSKVWHQQIDDDLYYYHFKDEGIILHYASGKKEMIAYNGKKKLRY